MYLENIDGKIYLKTNLYEYLPKMEIQFINTAILGEAFEPEQKFESPDGRPIIFDRDYMGQKRTFNLISGPFADKKEIEEPIA